MADLEDVKIQDSSNLEEDVKQDSEEPSAEEEIINEEISDTKEEVETPEAEVVEDRPHQESIPYDRFKEVNEKAKALEAEVERLKSQPVETEPVNSVVEQLLESDIVMAKLLDEQMNLYDMETNTAIEEVMKEQAIRRVESDIEIRKTQIEQHVNQQLDIQTQGAKQAEQTFQDYIKDKKLEGEALDFFKAAITEELNNKASKLATYDIKDALDIIYWRNQDRIPKGKVVKTTTDNPKRQIIANMMESKGSPNEKPDSDKSLREILAESYKEVADKEE
jgi:hypothetical protein